MLTQTPRLLDLSRQAIRSLHRIAFEGVTSSRKLSYGLLRPATTRVAAQTYLLTNVSQDLLLGGVVPVGDGSEALQTEIGIKLWWRCYYKVLHPRRGRPASRVVVELFKTEEAPEPGRLLWGLVIVWCRRYL